MDCQIRDLFSILLNQLQSEVYNKIHLHAKNGKLPGLIRVLFNARDRVDLASDWRFIITRPFRRRRHFSGRAHHQTFVNSTEELGEFMSEPEVCEACRQS